VVAVTPIIGGKAIKGPAAKMMAELRLDVSAETVALRYAGIIDGFVIDHADALPEPLQGIRFFSAATLMNTTDDRLRLAHAVLQAADTLRASQM
jgi:LPPG:FO 2-phospho-L-lactate transferase